MGRVGFVIRQRSKLEMQVDIIKALDRHGPLEISHIMDEVNIDCSALEKHLEFLIQNNLVEEQTSHKTRVVYAITQRGQTTLKYLREINRAFQVNARAPV